MPEPERQSVLVLGARGFIGRRIIERLRRTSWARPIAASRHIVDTDLGRKVDTVRLDATNREQLGRILASADAVISCIAGSTRDILESGQALIEMAAQRAAPPRIVWLSSIAAYGSAQGAVMEQTPLLGDLGPYSHAKATIDALAAHFPFVVRLRPGIVYGPESPWWSDRIARLLIAHRLGDLGRAGEGLCNLVHVDDVATAVMRALRTHGIGGEAFNLGSPNPPTWNAYFARYAHALGALPVAHISAARLQYELLFRGPLLKLAPALMRRSAYLAARPAIRPWLMELCHRSMRIDVTKAQQVLRIRWRPLSAGLEQTARWFLDGGRTP